MQNLKAKKSLGQNFLQDENILSKIADSIETNNDLIIEIGPGMGALTKKLINKNSYVIAYEIDERTKPYLLPLENEKTKIIYKDFLETDLKEDLKNLNYQKLYIIANIPYYITTPIIEHIIDSEINIDSMVLLVQKEVAERFSAKPKSKDYGSLTVYLNYYFNIEKLFNVKNTCFNPIPKVDSAVVKFIRKDNISDINNKDFSKFVKECFSMKRKTLRNNLKNYDFNTVKEVLFENGYNESVRAEELDLDTFVKLYNKIVK